MSNFIPIQQCGLKVCQPDILTFFSHIMNFVIIWFIKVMLVKLTKSCCILLFSTVDILLCILPHVNVFRVFIEYYIQHTGLPFNIPGVWMFVHLVSMIFIQHIFIQVLPLLIPIHFVIYFIPDLTPYLVMFMHECCVL